MPCDNDGGHCGDSYSDLNFFGIYLGYISVTFPGNKKHTGIMQREEKEGTTCNYLVGFETTKMLWLVNGTRAP